MSEVSLILKVRFKIRKHFDRHGKDNIKKLYISAFGGINHKNGDFRVFGDRHFPKIPKFRTEVIEGHNNVSSYWHKKGVTTTFLLIGIRRGSQQPQPLLVLSTGLAAPKRSENN